MNVRPSSLHLSAALPGSGSDIAAQRLCKALIASGSRADWLSLSTYRKGDSPDHPSNHLFWTRSSRNSRLLSRALDRLDYRRTGIHLSLTPGLRTRSLNNWPVDLIHLHWLGTGFLSLFSLKHLSKPLVWTLHDLWPIQGVLPYPPTDGAPSRGMGLDFDPMILFLKRRLLPHRVQFIAPSSWAARVAEKSPVFASLANPRPIVVIPNSVDSTFFDSVPAGRPSQASRHPMLLFGGSNVFSDRRKGWHLLKPLLPWLASSYPHWRIASFGELPPPELRFSPQWQHLGLLKCPHELARLYRSADLLVMPSQQETFGQVAAEAQACGLPVVALSDSGVESVVDHQITGFLIHQPTTQSLKEGLRFFMDHPERLVTCRMLASQSAQRRFAPQLVAAQHLHLYQQMMAPHSV